MPTPQSLLASLHSHSSALFTSTLSLLPPLTSTTPLLPPHLLTHFAQLQESLHAEEEALLGSLKRKGQMNEVKRGRIGRLGGGSRKGAWANAERAFESSALVAMGMFEVPWVSDEEKGHSLILVAFRVYRNAYSASGRRCTYESTCCSTTRRLSSSSR